jgi:hypothetical protein
MDYRLKSRVKQIPNGLKFVQPEVGWDSVKVLGKFPSWEVLVNAVVALRMANQAQAQKHGWSVDVNAVAQEVDAYNTRLCLEAGWSNFVQGPGGRSPPKSFPPGSLMRSSSHAAAGGKVLLEWLNSGAEAVSTPLADKRASVCTDCPMNQRGDLLSFFTRPVSEAIRAALNLRSSWNLRTDNDANLGVCQACNCPLKLMVHVPLELKLKSMNQETLDALHPSCWILSELRLSTRVDKPDTEAKAT